MEASLTSLSSPGWIVTAFLATQPILCSQTAEFLGRPLHSLQPVSGPGARQQQQHSA